MKMLLPIAMLALSTMATPVLAKSDADPANPKPKRERMICRSNATTGSRLTSQTCRTKAQWALIDQEVNSRQPVVLDPSRLPSAHN